MKPVIAIHGGASVLRADRPGARHRAVLEEALEAGYEILKKGDSSLAAVAASVVVLEDSPLFNAGRGSSFNSAGEIEMDASIMDGATLRAGAVAAVRHIRNPILAARAVMEASRHVLLAADGAERFARSQGLKIESPAYFRTARRLAALRKNLKNYHGTVGAVALDTAGNLAAATSTGGYTGKLPGRVGDSPIIGAGTYADNRACAVSGTGLGEAFIRAAVGHDVCARMLYANSSVGAAAAAALQNVGK
ncbi:MAG: isoaspartyl peptidase/L-asparaginase family protein, partial [Burkholderiales bacterium]